MTASPWRTTGPLGYRALARSDLVLLGVAVALAIGAATQNYFVDFSSWRFDLLQAIDDSGTYLFVVSPFYAGLACWLAARESARLHELAVGLPSRSLMWRAAWLVIAAPAAAIHVIVMVATISTALLSGALSTFQVTPFLVQFASILGFTAFGAAVGGLSRSRIAAPALFLILLLLNTVFASLGFRRLSDVGTGSADFIDLRMPLSYELPKLALFVAVLGVSLPLRRRPARLIAVVLSVILATYGVAGLAAGSEPTQYRPTRRSCWTAGATQVCAPEVVARYAPALDDVVRRMDQLLSRNGVRSLPSRVDIVSRAAEHDDLPIYHGRRVAVPITAAALHSAPQLTAELRMGYSYALQCPDSSSDQAPNDSIILGRAVLDGWLQVKLDQVEPGSFPRDNVDRLLRLPAQQRAKALDALFRQVTECRSRISVPGVL